MSLPVRSFTPPLPFPRACASAQRPRPFCLLPLTSRSSVAVRPVPQAHAAPGSALALTLQRASFLPPPARRPLAPLAHTAPLMQDLGEEVRQEREPRQEAARDRYRHLGAGRAAWAAPAVAARRAWLLRPWCASGAGWRILGEGEGEGKGKRWCWCWWGRSGRGDRCQRHGCRDSFGGSGRRRGVGQG